MNNNIDSVSIADLDRSLQVRTKPTDPATVAAYALAMKEEGANFPPVVVYEDEERVWWLADGHQRTAAAEKNGDATIKAEVRKGTRLDALTFAWNANAGHGLLLSREDRRNIVRMFFAEYPTTPLSNRKIAEQLKAVSFETIRKMRPELQPLYTETSPASDNVVNAGGKKPAKAKGPNKAKAVKAAEPEAPAPVKAGGFADLDKRAKSEATETAEPEPSVEDEVVVQDAVVQDEAHVDVITAEVPPAEPESEVTDSEVVEAEPSPSIAWEVVSSSELPMASEVVDAFALPKLEAGKVGMKRVGNDLVLVVTIDGVWTAFDCTINRVGVLTTEPVESIATAAE